MSEARLGTLTLFVRAPLQVWLKQMSFSRSLSQVKEMQGALKLSETMHAAMQHFVNQIQYYFVFEVLECSWHDLTKAVRTSG